MEWILEKIQPPKGHSFRLLRWENSVRDVYVVSSPNGIKRIVGEGSHWHYHPALELTLFSKGHGTRFVGDRIESFGPGDLVLLGANLPHYWHAHGKSAGLSVQWDFPASHPFWMFPETFPIAACFKEAERGIHFGGATAQMLAALLHRLAEAEGPTQFSIFIQILSTFVTAPAGDKVFISSQLFSLKSESRHLSAIQAAIRFVLINFRDEIRLPELLEVAHMSRPTFSRQFRKHSGKTLTQFVQHVRLASACRELAASDAPIIEIGLRSGFSEVSFFNRVFQREMGCTPSRYRARARRKSASIDGAPRTASALT